MKKLFLFCSIIAALMMFAATDAKSQRYYEQLSYHDSLVNQDTVIRELDFTFKRPFYHSIQIKADSVSGANQGLAYLQYTNDVSTASTARWHTAQTLTIDGTGTDNALYEGLIYARRVRLYYISPSGTRKVRIYTDISIKQAY